MQNPDARDDDRVVDGKDDQADIAVGFWTGRFDKLKAPS
jgi:hypothetical protein